MFVPQRGSVMKEKFILVINDDKEFTDSIVNFLEKEGFCIIMAENEHVAFKHIERKKPGLILLDIQKPAGKSLEVCRILKARPSTSAIPVIIFSAKTSLNNMMSGYLAGANRYIGRPFELSELGECVQNILRQQDNHNNNSINMANSIS
jgi:DNA-binding response OmpR family regulator